MSIITRRRPTADEDLAAGQAAVEDALAEIRATAPDLRQAVDDLVETIHEKGVPGG